MSDLNMDELSPVLRAMAAILADGMPHPVEELHKCCGPSSRDNVRKQLFKLRAFLPRGEAVICEIRYKKAYYRHVRLLCSPNDGKR